METRLLKKQMTSAYQYSYTRLVLNYYTLYETMTEEQERPGKLLDCLGSLNELIEAYFSGNDIRSRLNDLRDTVIHEVEVLTSYTDCFQIYEYVLNRLERKFKTLPETGYNDETFTGMLVQFVTNTKESAVMNSRIKQIIGQLPIRLTKQKFFSLVMEGLSVYLGSPLENLQDIMYTLKTESMTQLPVDMAKEHEALYETLERFRHTDYRNMTAASFEEAQARLMGVSDALYEEAELYMSFQEIINDLYVLALAKEHAVLDMNENQLYQSIILGILEQFKKSDVSLPEDSYTSMLRKMEGRQEAYYEKYLRSELPPETAELLMDSDYVDALNIDRLLSGSAFMELKKPETGSESGKADLEEILVDRALLEQTAEEYFKELESVFSETSRPVVRAVMAKVLSDLPICFGSIDEIQSYIRRSLESCGDEAEKETCKELLEELMDYENKLV